jgi:predicted transcriptional regulator
MNCLICNTIINKANKKYCSKECQSNGWRLENKSEKEIQQRYIAKFNKKISKTDTCWLWKGYIDNLGYGRIHIYGKTEKAHRASFIFFKKKKIDGLCVLHKCDNRSCVNPKHLFLGTQLDNIKDMVNKKRNNTAKGEANYSATINSNDAIKIKTLLKSGMSCTEIAKFLNVKRSTVYLIKYNKSWNHIKI